MKNKNFALTATIIIAAFLSCFCAACATDLNKYSHQDAEGQRILFDTTQSPTEGYSDDIDKNVTMETMGFCKLAEEFQMKNGDKASEQWVRYCVYRACMDRMGVESYRCTNLAVDQPVLPKIK